MYEYTTLHNMYVFQNTILEFSYVPVTVLVCYLEVDIRASFLCHEGLKSPRATFTFHVAVSRQGIQLRFMRITNTQHTLGNTDEVFDRCM